MQSRMRSPQSWRALRTRTRVACGSRAHQVTAAPSASRTRARGSAGLRSRESRVQPAWRLAYEQRSRSWMSRRRPRRKPSTASVRFRATCFIHRAADARCQAHREGDSSRSASSRNRQPQGACSERQHVHLQGSCTFRFDSLLGQDEMCSELPLPCSPRLGAAGGAHVQTLLSALIDLEHSVVCTRRSGKPAGDGVGFARIRHTWSELYTRSTTATDRKCSRRASMSSTSDVRIASPRCAADATTIASATVLPRTAPIALPAS